DGDAPFMHLVGVDRGDGIGIERDNDQPVLAGGGLPIAHRDAQAFNRMEIDRPWPSRPSTSAMVTAGSARAASAAGVQPSSEVRFMKSRTPSPEAKRAERAVGRTWLEPPT